MIEYRITNTNDSILREIGKDNWILSCISDGKMYFYREVKKTKKQSTGIVIHKTYFESTELTEKFKLYEQHRKEKNVSLKETAREQMIKKLKAYPVDIAIRMLQQSIENGWTGVIELKESKSEKQEDISKLLMSTLGQS